MSLCCGYTLAGRREEAKNAVKEVVSLDPEFSVSNYIELRPYKYKDQDTENRFIESLIDAGLQR